MDFEQFIAMVARRAQLSRDDALRAARAVLRTLAQRLNRGEVRRLVDRLPLEFSPWLFHDGDAEAYDVDEFLSRVAARAGVDIQNADRLARIVFSVLREALDAEEVAALAASLPEDLHPIFLNLAVPSEGELVADVAGRMGGGSSTETARRAVEAVLETLAERIAPGEVDDLISRLPISFHDALRRGAAQRNEQTRRRTADEFVAVVAGREGVDRETGRRHIRAVLAGLRAALGDEEFSDMVVELPKDYDLLLPAAV
jgi:uncharacterized protein (DUF2267 family)